MNADEPEIVSRLHQFSENYSHRKLNGVLACFSRNPVPAIIVSGRCDSPIIGLPAIRQAFLCEFQRTNPLQLRTRWLSLEIMQNTAWIVSCSEVLSQPPAATSLTAVLVRENASWSIAHLHFSSALDSTEAIGLPPSKNSLSAPIESFPGCSRLASMQARMPAHHDIHRTDRGFTKLEEQIKSHEKQNACMQPVNDCARAS